MLSTFQGHCQTIVKRNCVFYCLFYLHDTVYDVACFCLTYMFGGCFPRSVFCLKFNCFVEDPVFWWWRVRLSVRMEQLGCHWSNFHEFWVLFLKIWVEHSSCIKIWQEWRLLYIWALLFIIIFRWIVFRKGAVWKEICVKNQNIRFVFSKFFPKTCPLWDNVEKYCRARQATGDNIMPDSWGRNTTAHAL